MLLTAFLVRAAALTRRAAGQPCARPVHPKAGNANRLASSMLAPPRIWLIPLWHSLLAQEQATQGAQHYAAVGGRLQLLAALAQLLSLVPSQGAHEALSHDLLQRD